MAIFRLEAKLISRSKGRSVVAAAAYRSGSRLVDARTGEVADYRRRHGVLHSEILAPENAPRWVFDRETLWSNVELSEKRADAQLAREIVLGLPNELALNEQLALTKRFVNREFVGRGMVADIAIHAPSSEGDERNFHAHVLLSLREIDGGGFRKKNRSWNDRQLLEGWRMEWAKDVNAALAQSGLGARVDHRSLRARRQAAKIIGNEERVAEVDRHPMPKMGPIATAIERRNRRTRSKRSGPITDRGKELARVQRENDIRWALNAGRLRMKRRLEREMGLLGRHVMREFGWQLRVMLEELVEIDPPQRTRQL